MLLFFTGRSRSSAAIIDEQKKNTETGKGDAVEAMHRIKQSAIDMKLALLKGDIQAIADILRQAWEDKKKMATNITNPMIQEAMDTAMQAGAKAGKVSGAGGGGFIMFIVEPTRKKEVEAALKKLNGFVMPFNFSEGGAHGWKIYETDSIKAF
jgi:D-glycero-alpha-D-manno-heptose-7-phosphate kinase